MCIEDNNSVTDEAAGPIKCCGSVIVWQWLLISCQIVWLAGWLALIRFHTCLKCAEANECLYGVN